MSESNAETPTKESWASRNRRHLIAVCMVILMLAFLVPSQFPNLTQRTNPVVGKLNGQPVRYQDLNDARVRWSLLKNIVVEGPRGQVPLVNLILGERLVMTFDRHADAYMLLLKEAHEDGPGGSDSMVNRLIESGYPSPTGRSDIEVVLEDGRIVGFGDLRQDYAERYRLVLADLFAILNRYSIFESSVKPTAPLVDRRVASANQTIHTRLIDFRAADYLDRVPQPTEEQLQQHFKLYAGSSPGEITPENEFGFGYKVPNQVKLQTIRIPAEAVRELTRNTKDVTPDRDDPTLPYGWVVEAYKYYVQNKSEFIPHPDESTTRPSTAPTTTSTEPQPFPEIRKQLVERLINQQTVRTMQQIQQRIRNRMEADYQVWKTAREMKTPTTQSSFGVPFESIEYLNALVADVESQFKVKLSTRDLTDQFYDINDLTTLPDIGQAVVRMDMGGQPQLLPFASYAIQLYVPLIDPADAEEVSQISLDPFELSDMVQQYFDGEDQFLFRVTDYEASHVATEMGKSRSRVERDWKRAEALKLAQADADATMKAIAKSGEFASPTTRPAMQDITISLRDGAPLALELEGAAGQQFMEKSTIALLDVNLPNNLVTFTVPLADRAFLAKRDRVVSDWSNEVGYEQARSQVGAFLTSMLLTPDFNEPDLAAERRRRDYFDVENIYRRNNYELEQSEREPSASQPSK